MDEQGASATVDPHEERNGILRAYLVSASVGLLAVVGTISLLPVVSELERAKYEQWLGKGRGEVAATQTAPQDPTPHEGGAQSAESQGQFQVRRAHFSQAYLLRVLLEYDPGSDFPTRDIIPIERDGGRIIMAASIDEAEPRQSRVAAEPPQFAVNNFRILTDRLSVRLSRLEDQVVERTETVRGVLHYTGVRIADAPYDANDERDAALVPPELITGDYLSPALVERAAQVAARITEFRRLAAMARATPFARPVAVDYNELRGYGLVTNASGQVNLHLGLDIGAFAGAPIVATAPGTVAFAGSRGAPYGNVVEIDHGQGFKTRYAGLSDAQVRPGAHVAIGQRIASMGTTAEGHEVSLHYEVWFRGRAVDPVNFLRAGRFVYRSGS